MSLKHLWRNAKFVNSNSSGDSNIRKILIDFKFSVSDYKIFIRLKLMID